MITRRRILLSGVISTKEPYPIIVSTLTGTTGKKIIENTNLKVNLLKSGPFGGDMELGAMIANEKLDILIFFWDPLESQPHDVDVKAVLRLAVLYNIPTACNRATADMIISSPLFNSNH